MSEEVTGKPHTTVGKRTAAVKLLALRVTPAIRATSFELLHLCPQFFDAHPHRFVNTYERHTQKLMSTME